MKLSPQDLPEIEDVTEADIERVLGDDTFAGKYAMFLSRVDPLEAIMRHGRRSRPGPG